MQLLRGERTYGENTRLSPLLRLHAHRPYKRTLLTKITTVTLPSYKCQPASQHHQNITQRSVHRPFFSYDVFFLCSGVWFLTFWSPLWFILQLAISTNQRQNTKSGQNNLQRKITSVISRVCINVWQSISWPPCSKVLLLQAHDDSRIHGTSLHERTGHKKTLIKGSRGYIHIKISKFLFQIFLSPFHKLIFITQPSQYRKPIA